MTMQDVPAEHNRAPAAVAAVLGAALAALAICACAWARMPLAPTPAQCLAGDGAWAARHLDALIAAAVAAAGAVLAGLWYGPARRSDGFARTAVVAFAAGLPLSADAAGIDPGGGAVGGALLAGAGLAAAVALSTPLWRDRHLALLALLAVPAALPALWAFREARLCGHVAQPIAAVRAAMAQLGSGTVLLVGDEVGDELRAALPRALQPPFAATAQPLLLAGAGSPAAEWVQRMDWPVFALREGECEPCPLPQAAARLRAGLLAVSAAVDRDAGGLRVAVHADAMRPGSQALLLTPVGEFAVGLDENGRGELSAGSTGASDAAARRRFALLGALPPGLPIRVLVVPADPADAYGWTDVAT
jgi:hypothetical protein